MHYQHAYHAGNFADVFKHVLLVALLEAVSAKKAPWCFIDTHAGAGLYDLSSSTGQEAPEWRRGIGRLWASSPHDALLRRYLDRVRTVAGDGDNPQAYPGSPWWALQLARDGDRVVACEQEAKVVALLKHAAAGVEIQQRNGYELLSQLPPRERRGLVLVDPPFERVDEFDAARSFITGAAPRFPGGVFMLWYPLKNRHAADHALRCLARDTAQPLLDWRLDVGSHGDGCMHTCGIAILRAPYQFEGHARSALEELAARFGPRAQLTVRAVDFS